MPFDPLVPRPFECRSVLMFAPAMPGLYGISNAREWIFIGQTGNIQGALLAHLEDGGSAVMKRAPTGFVYEICPEANQFSRCSRLVLEYHPAENKGQQ